MIRKNCAVSKVVNNTQTREGVLMDDSEPTFHIELICEELKTTKVENLTLEVEPITFLDIKEAVEKRFSIPVCVQTLILHQSTKVADSEHLASYYVRSGDTFQVIYPIEGDCQKVLEVVGWLAKLADVFASHSNMKEYVATGDSFQLDQLGYSKCTTLISGEYMDLARDLSLSLVFPWTDKAKYVNKLHMDSLDVVRLVMCTYKCAVYARLSETPLYNGYYLEVVCALFVANFAQTFPLRRRIMEHRGLEYCIQTFLRCSATELFSLSIDAIEVSLYAICK